MARRRTNRATRVAPRVEQGTGRVLTTQVKAQATAVAKPKPAAAQTIGPGLVYPVPTSFPGLYEPPALQPSKSPDAGSSGPSYDPVSGKVGANPSGKTYYDPLSGKYVQMPAQATTSTTTPPATTDHSAQLGLYGIPPDVSAAVDAIFRQYPNDPSSAAQAAIAYVRGTDWYKQAFIGIDAARANGFIGTDLGSEQQYKQYVNSYNVLYQQYYGRTATPAELANLFGGAVDPNYLAKQFQGTAYWQANKPDLNYLEGAFGEGGKGAAGTLSNEQGLALGYQNAGIDTRLGQLLQGKIAQAQQRLQTVFSGTLATPNLTLGQAGLAAPSLAGGKTTPDVAA